ncbi:hypothetical protein L4D09_11440 [Photobacterium makurazakiensis]
MLSIGIDIQVVEPLGPNQLVQGNLGEQRFIAVTPEQHFDIGTTLVLHIKKPNLHLFDTYGSILIVMFLFNQKLESVPFN